MLGNLSRFILVGGSDHNNNHIARISLHQKSRILKGLSTINFNSLLLLITGIVLSNIYAQLEMLINEHLFNLQLVTDDALFAGKDAEAGSCLINDTVNQFL
ncbi:hypothetical protein YTPLAS72_31300 [Nitrospira sp.]|nr:hypothetical protein YTPLAS72_31300 [Nitrospira sp.]